MAGQIGVLVPLDHSAHAQAALPYAEAIVRATGGAIHLLAAVEPAPSGIGAPPEAVRAEILHAREFALRERLQSLAGDLAEREIEAHVQIVHGQAVDEILNAADADVIDLVVMATHGRGGMDRWMLGSVADKVMRLCTRPTLLVRPPEGTQPARWIEFKRIMVPLDGSPLAETALDLAAPLARATGATLTLVRVEPWVSSMVATLAYVPNLDTMEADQAALAEDYLFDVAQRLPDGLHTEQVTLRGIPSAVLLDFATREEVDLVVMTTHGAGGLRRFALGSNADRLVRAGVPSLLVRAAAVTSGQSEDPRLPVAQEGELRCGHCGRLITHAVAADERCPRCRMHLHACVNCVFWDELACVLQREEAHDPVWAGRQCPRFMFRPTRGRPVDTPPSTADSRR